MKREHIINHDGTYLTKPENRAIAPLEQVYRAIVFGAKDYSEKQSDALLYGIIVGWDDDEVYKEFTDKWGWTNKDIAAIEQLRDLFKKLEIETWR